MDTHFLRLSTSCRIERSLLPACLRGTEKFLQFGGSREPENARGRALRRGGEFLHEGRQILLVDIPRHDEEYRPEYDLADKAEPRVAPNGAQHPVIVARERFYFFEQFFLFRIHVRHYSTRVRATRFAQACR